MARRSCLLRDAEQGHLRVDQDFVRFGLRSEVKRSFRTSRDYRSE